jgi:hypothetical protein
MLISRVPVTGHRIREDDNLHPREDDAVHAPGLYLSAHLIDEPSGFGSIAILSPRPHERVLAASPVKPAPSSLLLCTLHRSVAIMART